MPIKHVFQSEKPDGVDPSRIQPSHWNANHKIVGVTGYELVEEKTLSGVPSTTFTGLNGVADEEYLIEVDIQNAASNGVLEINFNGDTTAGNYTTYMQLQETDGNSHHLSNWNSNTTLMRFPLTTPFAMKGKAVIYQYPNNGVGYLSEFSMFLFGWGEAGGWWKKTGDPNITSITLKSGTNLTGKIRLFKKIPMV